MSILFRGELVWASVLFQVIAASGQFFVYRSYDQGVTWSRSDRGLPSGARINAFGAIGRTVFAGTDRGIYRSEDQGAGWKLATATSAHRILTFATLGQSVYAGTDRSGILMSPDGGLSWKVHSGTGLRNIRALLAHGGAVYAGTNAQGVLLSRDGGNSWSSMSKGLPAGAQVFSMTALDGKIYVGLYSKGLYVWTGLEPAWRKIGPVTPLALATDGRSLLAGHNPGGIYRSDDAGANWATGHIPFSADVGNAPVWEMGSGPGFAFAGVSKRIYRSNDGGRNWIDASAGLPERSSGIAFMVDDGFVLAALVVQPLK